MPCICVVIKTSFYFIFKVVGFASLSVLLDNQLMPLESKQNDFLMKRNDTINLE